MKLKKFDHNIRYNLRFQTEVPLDFRMLQVDLQSFGEIANAVDIFKKLDAQNTYLFSLETDSLQKIAVMKQAVFTILNNLSKNSKQSFKVVENNFLQDI